MSDPFLLPVTPPKPAPPADAADAPSEDSGAWQRQHISALFLGLLRFGRSLFNLIPAVAALGLSGNSRYIPFAIAGYFLLHIGGVLSHWLFTLYRIGPDSLSIRHGLFSRNERHIGFDRVQDISIEQGLLPRLLGVARISIETGAGSGEDVTLFPIKMEKAEALRETLRAYREQARPLAEAQDSADELSSTPSTPPASSDDSRLLFALPPRKLLLSGVFSPSLAVIALLGALIGFADRFEPFGLNIPSERELIAMIEAYVGSNIFQQNSSPRSIALVIAPLLLAIAALSLITGIIRTIFRDWDYRLSREPRTLRRLRGLTTRTDVAITIRRVQSATLVTGLIRQIFGWQELRLRSLASDIGSGEGGGDHQIIPFAQREEIDPILEEIGLLPNWEAVEWQRSHGILALPSFFTLILFAASAASFSIPAANSWGWPLFGAAILLLLIEILTARRHFHGVDGDKILIRSGLFRPSLTILPRRAIQSADISDNFLYRRLGLASLAFGVPGISSHADDRIPAISLSKATALRAAIFHRD